MEVPVNLRAGNNAIGTAPVVLSKHPLILVISWLYLSRDLIVNTMVSIADGHTLKANNGDKEETISRLPGCVENSVFIVLTVNWMAMKTAYLLFMNICFIVFSFNTTLYLLKSLVIKYLISSTVIQCVHARFESMS